MNIKSTRFVFGLASALVATAFVAGGAYAVTDTVFKYTTAKTGWYTIDHMAMGPDGNGSAADFFIGWGTGLSSGSNQCFNAGVNLPNGATITGVTVWYQSSASGAPVVELDRHKLSDGTGEGIGQATFTDTSNTRKAGTLTIDSTRAVVNNQAYSYAFGVCITADSKFHAARVNYTYTTAGD